MASNKKNILVKGLPITISVIKGEDFISLTDIARNKNPDEPKDVVKNWLRSKTTIEFLGLWEQLNNLEFKGVEFDSLLYQAGSNSFTLSPSRWIELTNAKGIVTKQGKSGGTLAHKDIAFEFATWISPEFKLYLIKEFQHLKNSDSQRHNLEWNIHRTLAKINYHIHTDAIKQNLIPKELNKAQINFVYSSEADLLNVALFGLTAKQWSDANPEKEGNMRDAATIEQLVVLSNLESINSVLISQKIPQSGRLIKLNEIAVSQMKSLINNRLVKKLK